MGLAAFPLLCTNDTEHSGELRDRLSEFRLLDGIKSHQ